ncbi:PLP-dependent aminotransferase family protein [Faecalicatena sp. AGMB00832]|uniref:PLP-dependent aminotransferase family protein n=2 Tax=Faecalicatena faecalis TaxID=2726362 RepID=A0ABS6D4K2_9FIRM|nr:PLP-dependent aminotransferase family protein [Faecalicatena faecalis]
MLTYEITRRGKTPIYEYLYQCIRRDILSGEIKAGEKLPSKRSLAAHLDISVVTVENAYSQLLLEGYIYSVECSGYYVSRLRVQNTFREDEAAPKLYQEEEASPYYADLRCNRIGMQHFPFSIWSKLIREVITARDERLLKAVPCRGVFELRKAIAENLHRFRGMNVSPSQIVIGAGTEFLYQGLFQILGEDALYGLEEIGYSYTYELLERNGVKWKQIEMDENGISIRSLQESGCNVMHVTPEHHFPTGIITPIGRRQELLNWAQEKGGYIIEDNFDSEFRYVNKLSPALFSMDKSGCVIYLNTFSKSIVPSMRISYMVLPEKLMKKYVERMCYSSCTVSCFEQHTLARFISEGYFERHLNRTRNFYKKLKAQLIQEIQASPLNEISKIKEAEAGTYFLLRLETKLTDDELVLRARKNGIDLACFSEYCRNPQKSKPHILIINYSGIRMEAIQETVTRLLKSVVQEKLFDETK